MTRRHCCSVGFQAQLRHVAAALLRLPLAAILAAAVRAPAAQAALASLGLLEAQLDRLTAVVDGLEVRLSVCVRVRACRRRVLGAWRMGTRASGNPGGSDHIM
jgi:hypothetical protein